MALDPVPGINGMTYPCPDASKVLGKAEAYTTPSPLPRGGSIPPIYRRAPFGPRCYFWRLRPEYPFRGVDCFDLRRLRIKILHA